MIVRIRSRSGQNGLGILEDVTLQVKLFSENLSLLVYTMAISS